MDTDELSKWEHIRDIIEKKKLLLTGIRKEGFSSRCDQHLQACECDDWNRERREKATVDSTVTNEDSWAEPRVNWREFELRLRYGRRCRKFLKIRRQEEEKEMMELRDKKREAGGFKLRERPSKKEVRLLETEEIKKKEKKAPKRKPTMKSSDHNPILLERLLCLSKVRSCLCGRIIKKSRQNFCYSYNLLGDCYLHGMIGEGGYDRPKRPFS